MNGFELLGLVFMISGLVLLLLQWMVQHGDLNSPKRRDKKQVRYAFLIPARYESRVISGLLDSIQKQTYKVLMKDVYVIIESEEDPTYQIAKKYGATIVVRKKLDLKRKGYALDEAMQYILEEKKHYDAYFVVDADNILDPDFLSHMHQSYMDGYEIAVGYRNCKNGNDSVVSACSTLTFFIINTLINRRKNRYHGNITVSGSGFFIDGDLLESMGCFPFHSLTEDYEMSVYATVNHLKTCYNMNACFYDEQPTRLHQTMVQRVRWIRGFCDVRAMYGKKLWYNCFHVSDNWGSNASTLIGIYPFLFFLMGFGFYCAAWIYETLMFSISNIASYRMVLHYCFFGVLMVYIILFFLTGLIFYLERGKLNLTRKMKLKALFIHPLYCVTYIPCFLKAVFAKEVSWDVIEHVTTEIK